ncbi:UDP-N-acetylmuramate dehydrogenase [Rhodohalobacter sp. 8-1]|uniref:UDP-N-acetylmuramate dehydrogenase n=1 Tax=Rhodohalobacter sp. 8-1 TaxID=3131972 RepID=UPI0030EC1628
MPNAQTKSVSDKPVIRENVNLAPLNTLGVEAVARRFVEIDHPNQLRQLHDDGFFDRQIPIVLGGGSNLLFLNRPDRPVLKMSVSGRDIEAREDGSVLLKAGAGENWHQLVKHSIEKGLGGIENLALIPGTVGAAPIQNIGAYGVELKDVFHNLTAFEIETGKFRTYTAAECNFGYRDSIFKRELKNQVIVCDVTLQLTKNAHDLNVDYKGLNDHLESKKISDPTIKDIFNSVVEIRRAKLPDPSDIGNAGSFFKNPVLSEEQFETLRSNYPEMPSYKVGDDEYKIPAAWLIEKAGWKGKRVGNVGTYKNQALVIVNHGGATGEEIYNHALKIQESVRNTFDIDLRPEVNIVGNES